MLLLPLMVISGTSSSEAVTVAEEAELNPVTMSISSIEAFHCSIEQHRAPPSITSFSGVSVTLMPSLGALVGKVGAGILISLVLAGAVVFMMNSGTLSFCDIVRALGRGGRCRRGHLPRVVGVLERRHR